MPRGHSEQIMVDGEAEPATAKLGIRISNTKTRHGGKLDQEQFAVLRELGVQWASASDDPPGRRAQPLATADL